MLAGLIYGLLKLIGYLIIIAVSPIILLVLGVVIVISKIGVKVCEIFERKEVV